QVDFQNAFVDLGGYLVGIDEAWKGERAVERAERALEQIVLLFRPVLLLLLELLTSQGEDAILDRDLDVLPLEAGKLRDEQKLFLRIDDVHRRHPPDRWRDEVLLEWSERVVEEGPHAILELVKRREYRHQRFATQRAAGLDECHNGLR